MRQPLMSAKTGDLTHPTQALTDGRAAQRRHDLARDVGLCVTAYLYGSLPLVFLLGRQRQVDLRRSGSGNVGATNLMAAGHRSGAVIGWIFDASKGMLPIFVGRQIGYSRTVAELAGVCGVAGQCWPLFLRFEGGRGISAYVGAGSQIDRQAWTASLLPMILGAFWRVASSQRHGTGNSTGRAADTRSKPVPLGCFVSTVVFGILAVARRRSSAKASIAPTLLSLVILLRRLTAPQPDDASKGPHVRPQALVYRLLYDRNTET
jgi:glycerol-3-phosphate acyltransferase PlsY